VHERHGGWWLGESNDDFSSTSGVAVVEVNGEASRGEAGAEEEERGSSSAWHSSYSRTRRWPRAADTVGGNGGGKSGEAMGGQGGSHGPNMGGMAAPLFGPCG
jgi:hypothetical protein